MSYQVLARKWRPRTFSEMVGQEHVLRALVHALDHDRLHHAYLFTGTRGVGKTTIARILAKSLNCEKGVSAQPCGLCRACQEIDAGRFVDLIEVDAASRTKVEDTRELLENVQYAPTRGRYKVYLIDEVHMLSAHSFNALLKTLEEPPPHVKFLLATTDPQRMPITILSRCLQFNLKCLSLEKIQRQLGYILEQEGIPGEPAALQLIARGAEGSMRDALSLLDQAIAYGGGVVKEQDLRDMLGSLEQDHLFQLLDALERNDAPRVLRHIQTLAEQAPDFGAVLTELISLLHRLALAQAVPAALDESLGDRDKVMELARRLSAEDIQLFYQIGLIARRDLPLVPDPRSGLEMALLRMLVFRPMKADGMVGQAPAARTIESTESTESTGAQAATEPSGHARPKAFSKEDWERIVQSLGLGGLTQQLAMNCVLREQRGEIWHLELAERFRHLHNQERERRLTETLAEYLTRPIVLKISIRGEALATTPAMLQVQRDREQQEAAVQAISNDTVVQTIRDTFGASIVPESIRPTARD
jgi:DNA polymerase-3 subunit gamma/tau